MYRTVLSFLREYNNTIYGGVPSPYPKGEHLMIVSGMVLSSPTLLRGVPHMFECVLFSDRGERTDVSINVIHALRRGFPGATIDLGRSIANLPIIRLECGPIYRTEAILYIGGKFAGAVSLCFGGIPVDLHTFVRIGHVSQYSLVQVTNWHTARKSVA